MSAFRARPDIVDTADAAAVLVAPGDLRSFVVHIQVTASAGTALLEVTGPGGLWVTHTAAIDCTADVLVILGATITETYASARVTFTGTSSTNTLSVSLEPR